MRFARVSMGLLCCLFALGMFASAQVARPGLYVITSNVTWVQSPFPPGMQLPPGMNSPIGDLQGSHPSCVTQEEIDRYGTVLPEPHGECHLANVSKNSRGMTADLVCDGEFMVGKGTVVASWTPDAQGTAKVHFTGAMHFGEQARPAEWIAVYTSVYKGRNCGSVRPTPIANDSGDD